MEDSIPPHFMMHKVTSFRETEDPKIHIKVSAQMFNFRGLDSVRCKMIMGTFVRMYGFKLEGVNGLKRVFENF